MSKLQSSSGDLEKYNRNCDMVKKWRSCIDGFGDISTLWYWGRSSACAQAKAVLEEMIVQLSDDIKSLSRQDESLQKQLEDVAQKTVDAQGEVTANEEELNALQTHLAELEKEFEEHVRSYEALRSELIDLDKKQQEAIFRRVKGAIPPGPNIFLAVLNGRPLEAIPFYNQISAIVSFCEQDYENAKRRHSSKKNDYDKCNQKLSTTAKDANDKEEAVRSSESRLQALEAKMDRLTKAQGVITRQKTEVSTRLKSITDLRDKTGFLIKDANVWYMKQDVKTIFDKKAKKVISGLRLVMNGMVADYKVAYDQAQELKKLLA